MKQVVPVYKHGSTVWAVPLDVEVDAAGDAWLTPEQTDELEAARKLAKAYAQVVIDGSNRIRRSRIKGSRRFMPPTLTSAQGWYLTSVSISGAVATRPTIRV